MIQPIFMLIAWFALCVASGLTIRGFFRLARKYRIYKWHSKMLRELFVGEGK